MRHRIYGKHLGRDHNARNALFKNLVQALFIHGTIQTTESKAKAVKGLIDKIVNLAKNKNRKHLLQIYLSNKEIIERVVKDIAPKLDDRNSGYTSIVKLGTRLGDQAQIVKVSLIRSEKLNPLKKEEKTKKESTPPLKKEEIKTQKPKVVVKKVKKNT